MADHGRISPDSAGYPAGLMDLEKPPSIFVSGQLREGPAVAVVGTRRCTGYGVDLAMEIGSSLARAGWSVVSGLALGIDAAGHHGALDAGGHVVGVLGTGIDVRYPKANHRLYDRIEETEGVLISEYPPGTGPERWRFPERNRLIAAIASAVVVVEAGEKGGALITARIGGEIGRPVFAVPGDVDRGSSVGCNQLIRDGAFPVLGGSDLVEELSLLLGQPRLMPPGTELVPATGLGVDELPGHWGVGIKEALGRLGRLQASGEVTRMGDRVYPA